MIDSNLKKVVIITAMPSPYRDDFFKELINHYPQYSFYILYITSEKGIRDWKIEQNKLKNARILKSKKIVIKKDLDDWNIIISYGVCRELRKIRPDVIIGAEYNLAIQQALLYAKWFNVPFISWTDGSPVSEMNINKIQYLLRKRVYRNASSFIASSSRSKELQLQYGADENRIYTSFITVNLNKFRFEKNDYSNDLLYVGSLIKRKGVDLLLNALVFIHQDYTLHIVGSGREEEELRDLAASLGIGSKVIFHGFVQQEELKELYSKAGIFILPTREDCFGLVTLEAMCASLPIVTSKYADGAFDLVEDGYNGYVVDPNDARGFGLKIETLLSNKEKCREFGRKSLLMTSRFEFSEVMKPFIQAIESVLI